jgi:hypothetical protein
VKTDGWDVTTAGFSEIDLVAHSGDSGEGERGECILSGGAESPEKRSGGFATYRVDHDSELFGELSRKIPA